MVWNWGYAWCSFTLASVIAKITKEVYSVDSGKLISVKEDFHSHNSAILFIALTQNIVVVYKVNPWNFDTIDQSTVQSRPRDLNATPQDWSPSAAVFASLYIDDPMLGQNS